MLSLRSADTASDRPRAHPKNCARAVGVIVSVQEGGIAPASEGGFRSFGRSWISQTPSKEAISCGRGQLAGAMLQRPFLAPQRKLLPVFKFLARGSLCARLLTVLAVALSHLSSVCLWIRVSFLFLASGFSPLVMSIKFLFLPLYTCPSFSLSSLWLSVCLCACLSVYLSSCLSVSKSVASFLFLALRFSPFAISVKFYFCLNLVSLSVFPSSLRLSVCLFVCVFVYLSLLLSLCVFLFIPRIRFLSPFAISMKFLLFLVSLSVFPTFSPFFSVYLFICPFLPSCLPFYSSYLVYLFVCNIYEILVLP